MYVDSMGKAEYMVNCISQWIREQVQNANCEGTVIGLSGGVDSSVVAALCSKAFPDHTLGLIMPCYSNSQDEKDAKLLAGDLGIETKYINLSPSYDTLKEKLDQIEFAPEMALANIKPRLRMTVLYYYAQTNKYLVVGTGNKSENLLGYFTKYGDGAVDIAPLANLTKLEVYQLAKALHLPPSIIQKPPSAGIINGQTDEEELGFSYVEMEKYFSGEKIDPEVREKIEKLIETSQHKRSMPPEFDPSKCSVYN